MSFAIEFGRYTIEAAATPFLEDVIAVACKHGRPDLIPRAEAGRLMQPVSIHWNGAGTTRTSSTREPHKEDQLLLSDAVEHGTFHRAE